jgi:hypothetical protein
MEKKNEIVAGKRSHFQKKESLNKVPNDLEEICKADMK